MGARHNVSKMAVEMQAKAPLDCFVVDIADNLETVKVCSYYGLAVFLSMALEEAAERESEYKFAASVGVVEVVEWASWALAVALAPEVVSPSRS